MKLLYFAIFLPTVLTINTTSGIDTEGFTFLDPLKLFRKTGFGGNIVFNCSTSDPNAITSLWFRKLSAEPRELPTIPNKLVKEGNVFVLLKTDVKVGGAYRCKATNLAGKVISTAESMLFIDPSMAAMPEYEHYPNTSQYRNVGESVKFRLKATTVQPTIRWRKAVKKEGHHVVRGPITAMHNVKEHKTFAFFSSTLSLNNLRVTDSGTYEAVAEHKGKEVVSRFHLKVNALPKNPPKVSWKDAVTSRMTVYQNNVTTVKLQCQLANTTPRPIITWFKNGKMLQPKENMLTSPVCSHVSDGLYFFTKGSKEDVVICGNPLSYETFAGRYTCRAENEIGVDEIHLDLVILAPAQIIEPKEKEMFVFMPFSGVLNITCRAKGSPFPKIEWWKIHRKRSTLITTGNDENGVQLMITHPSEKDLGKYSCVAENWHKEELILHLRKDTDPMKASSRSSFDAIVIAVTSFVVLALLGVVATCTAKQFKRKKTDVKYNKTTVEMCKVDSTIPSMEHPNMFSHDPNWEISEKQLIFGETLGSGSYGQILKAEAIGSLPFVLPKTTSSCLNRSCSALQWLPKAQQNKELDDKTRCHRTTVVVKMLKEKAAKSNYKVLASEINIMMRIGKHPNIINIIGICTRGQRLLLIMEYAIYGNLQLYLRQRQPVYRATWEKLKTDPKGEYTIFDMVWAAFQISNGMEFLASQKVVHRNLTAKSILVGEGHIMKVGDFSLAWDMNCEDDNDPQRCRSPIPFKWMALESLLSNDYTEKSDVWSFGIVLWEIFTLGQVPYPDIHNEDLLDFLGKDNRMPQPEHCPPELYAIMRNCWVKEQQNRPTFQVLVEQIGQILKHDRKDRSSKMAIDLDDKVKIYFKQKTASTSFCNEDTESLQCLMSDGYHEGESSDGDICRCESPLPALPPSLPDQLSDSYIADDNLPLPPVPHIYEEVLTRGQDVVVDEYIAKTEQADNVALPLERKKKKSKKTVVIDMQSIKGGRTRV